jgi:hypothetical protein
MHLHREKSSSGNGVTSSVRHIYRRENGLFEIRDGAFDPAGSGRWSTSRTSAVQPLAATDVWWHSITSAMIWVMANVAAGFASCAIAMHPELFLPSSEQADGDQSTDRRSALR